MNKPTFIESIKILDGKIYHLPLHQERMENTMKHHFGNVKLPLLSLAINIPMEYRKGLVKCRLLYTDSILRVDFQNYSFRKINRLKLVEDNDISYRFKAEDRTRLNRLSEQAKAGEEILIVKNGLLTDTSYSNIVLQKGSNLYTPLIPLLKGVKRRYLLDKGIIKEHNIEAKSLHEYERVYLINAMIDLDDEVMVEL